jgi:hypothetical protein
MSLLDISNDLLLLVASSLRYINLLNVSLVCKRLNSSLGPELYREYSNSRFESHSFLSFIRKSIKHPQVVRYVRSLDLHPWDTFSILSPYFINATGNSSIDNFERKY